MAFRRHLHATTDERLRTLTRGDNLELRLRAFRWHKKRCWEDRRRPRKSRLIGSFKVSNSADLQLNANALIRRSKAKCGPRSPIHQVRRILCDRANRPLRLPCRSILGWYRRLRAGWIFPATDSVQGA